MERGELEGMGGESNANGGGRRRGVDGGGEGRKGSRCGDVGEGRGLVGDWDGWRERGTAWRKGTSRKRGVVMVGRGSKGIYD